MIIKTETIGFRSHSAAQRSDEIIYYDTAGFRSIILTENNSARIVIVITTGGD